MSRASRVALAPRAALPLGVLLALAVLMACGAPSSGRSGLDLYTELCMRCHGDDGRGDPRQLTLAPALDLTRSVMVARGARGLIYQRISLGYGTMPAFGHKLERGDIQVLVDFVLDFQEN